MSALAIHSPRLRFNGGYHDGAAFVQRGKKGSATRRGDMDGMYPEQMLDWHFDRTYAAGWGAGYRDQEAGCYTENSSAAWEAHSA